LAASHEILEECIHVGGSVTGERGIGVEKIDFMSRLFSPEGLAMMRRLLKPQLIGCVVGTIEGLMPGGGGSIAAFLSYNEAKRWSKSPAEFGHGSPEGIAAPEAANNTVASTALIPLLSFGIPGSNSAAVLLGGLLIHGLLPGPRLF